MLLADLEGCNLLTVFQRLLLANSLITLESGAATIERNRELGRHFRAQEFDDGCAGEQIKGEIAFGLGPVQCTIVKLNQQRFEFWGLARLPRYRFREHASRRFWRGG